MSSRIKNGDNPASVFNLSVTTLKRLRTTDPGFSRRIVRDLEDYDRKKESPKEQSLECAAFEEKLRQLEECLKGQRNV